jgi:hypothetical protein
MTRQRVDGGLQLLLRHALRDGRLFRLYERRLLRRLTRATEDILYERVILSLRTRNPSKSTSRKSHEA